MKINIINLQKKILLKPPVSTGIKKIVSQTLLLEKYRGSGEISLCLVTDKIIAKLNKQYLNHTGPTDVISFRIPQDNPKKLVAEIAISTDTVITNSKCFNTQPKDELFFYVAHAVLHALGYNDDTGKKRIRMLLKQERICQSIKPKP